MLSLFTGTVQYNNNILIFRNLIRNMNRSKVSIIYTFFKSFKIIKQFKMFPKITKFYYFMRMKLFRFFINMNFIISIFGRIFAGK